MRLNDFCTGVDVTTQQEHESGEPRCGPGRSNLWRNEMRAFILAAVAGLAVGPRGRRSRHASSQRHDKHVACRRSVGDRGCRCIRVGALPTLQTLACMGAPLDARLPRRCGRRRDRCRDPAWPPRAGPRRQPHHDPFRHDHARRDFGPVPREYQHHDQVRHEHQRQRLDRHQDGRHRQGGGRREAIGRGFIRWSARNPDAAGWPKVAVDEERAGAAVDP